MRTIVLGVMLLFSSFALADVLEVNIWKSMPGKNQLTMQYGQEARAIMEKMGADVIIGADLEGRLHVATGFKNWAAWARFGSKMDNSKEWAAFLEKIAANPSAEREDHYLLNTPAPGRVGKVYQVFIFEPELGRGGDLVQSGMQAKTIHEKAGARITIHVDQLGKMHYLMSFDSWDAWGKFQDTPNPEFQAFMQAQGKDPKARLVKVYTANSL
ncbi:MAG: hypothetical protein O7F73_15625 [Gammaproteobacteria bacterium]|nr:hypothetical protein [Gammaproteobacteria bacterium]